ncbi:MAG: signal peptidase I [Chitinophagia bacterium]|jgi:signal peptidase I|nr:signal peptidase I [Chitinophagia bacterium]
MRLAFWKKKEASQPKKKKSFIREWVDAAVFAIVAASIIRIFLVEAYTIPTGSMEGSLLVNDYLFVSKVSYGARTPMTPLAVPLVHNTLPFFNCKSYTELVQWGYHRLPGFGHIERNDVVVFNFPAGDTVALEVQQDQDYYSLLRNYNNDRAFVKNNFTVLSRPVDKKENYIKRCVGIPGDTIEVRGGYLYVGNKLSKQYPHSKMTYTIATNGQVSLDEFVEEQDMNPEELNYDPNSKMYIANLANDQVAAIKKMKGVIAIAPFVLDKNDTRDNAFPNDTANFKWNRDFYGPFIVPKAGQQVTLSLQNIALYQRIIANYEHNSLDIKDGKIFINGKETTTYTFQMNYYWMMGDNRHNSADSRYFGFVPDDHIVGKAWFVWLSFGNKGIRWNRLFRSIAHLEQ